MTTIGPSGSMVSVGITHSDVPLGGGVAMVSVGAAGVVLMMSVLLGGGGGGAGTGGRGEGTGVVLLMGAVSVGTAGEELNVVIVVVVVVLEEDDRVADDKGSVSVLERSGTAEVGGVSSPGATVRVVVNGSPPGSVPVLVMVTGPSALDSVTAGVSVGTGAAVVVSEGGSKVLGSTVMTVVKVPSVTVAVVVLASDDEGAADTMVVWVTSPEVIVSV